MRCKDCCICYEVCEDGQLHETPCVHLKNKADYAEVKHGEWVALEPEIGLYSCSLCEHNILRAECNYCPNCGAKMDGRSDT